MRRYSDVIESVYTDDLRLLRHLGVAALLVGDILFYCCGLSIGVVFVPLAVAAIATSRADRFQGLDGWTKLLWYHFIFV